MLICAIRRNNTALTTLDVRGTALGCVPAGSISDTADILEDFSPPVRCPAGCEVGTVYDAAVGACVALYLLLKSRRG